MKKFDIQSIQVSMYPKKMDIHVSKYPCIQVCMISKYPIIQVSKKNQYPRYPCIRIYEKSVIHSSLLTVLKYKLDIFLPFIKSLWHAGWYFLTFWSPRTLQYFLFTLLMHCSAPKPLFIANNRKSNWMDDAFFKSSILKILWDGLQPYVEISILSFSNSYLKVA